MNIHDLMDLKIDFAFKQLFGNPNHKRITIAFLNAMLKRTGEDQIVSIEFENTEYEPEFPDDKLSRLDILATTDYNEKINIEIQLTNKYDMIKRSLFYWARVYKDQMAAGKTYAELKPTIMINIINYNQFRKETDNFHTSFHLYEDVEKFQLTDISELHFIEMRKLLVHWKQQKLNPKEDLLARWLLLLRAVDQQANTAYEDIYSELEDIAMKDEVLKEAFERWEILSADKAAKARYEARLKHHLDEYSAMREAEIRQQQAMEEGLKEGREKGLKEGLKAVAMNMLQNNVDINTIAKFTKLTIEEIEELKKGSN